jgi:hypothetical protein
MSRCLVHVTIADTDAPELLKPCKLRNGRKTNKNSVSSNAEHSKCITAVMSLKELCVLMEQRDYHWDLKKISV